MLGEPDACYVATVAGNINLPLNDPVRTVPTLGAVALAALLVLMAIAGLILLRQRKAA